MRRDLVVAFIAVLAVLATSLVQAQTDSFNDPKYPGIQPETTCPTGFDCTGFDGKIAPREDTPDMPPSLPDYTTAPYGKIREIGGITLPEHPEFGEVTLTTFATATKPSAGQSAVHLFWNTRSGEFKYAEWHTVPADGKTYVRCTFVYVNGAWVFQKLSISPVIYE